MFSAILEPQQSTQYESIVPSDFFLIFLLFIQSCRGHAWPTSQMGRGLTIYGSFVCLISSTSHSPYMWNCLVQASYTHQHLLISPVSLAKVSTLWKTTRTPNLGTLVSTQGAFHGEAIFWDFSAFNGVLVRAQLVWLEAIKKLGMKSWDWKITLKGNICHHFSQWECSKIPFEWPESSTGRNSGLSTTPLRQRALNRALSKRCKCTLLPQHNSLVLGSRKCGLIRQYSRIYVEHPWAYLQVEKIPYRVIQCWDIKTCMLLPFFPTNSCAVQLPDTSMHCKLCT